MRIFTYTYIYLYILYIYMCVCVLIHLSIYLGDLIELQEAPRRNEGNCSGQSANCHFNSIKRSDHQRGPARVPRDPARGPHDLCAHRSVANPPEAWAKNACTLAKTNRYTWLTRPCFLGFLQRASFGRALQVPSAPPAKKNRSCTSFRKVRTHIHTHT